MRLIQNFQQLANPSKVFTFGTRTLLICPMGGHTFFVDFVHFVGANLYFNPDIERSDNAGMKRLITVRFRGGNIVLKTARYHVVFAVNNSQGLITIGNRIHADTEGHNIAKLLE